MNKSSAFNASEFCHTLQLDNRDRPKVVSVPGHRGKQYQVILRRQLRTDKITITAECSVITPNGDVACKGNSRSICYHSLAAFIHASDCAGCKIYLCETERSAKLRKNIGGDVIRAMSYVSGKSVWLVVNLPEQLGRVGTVDDEIDAWMEERDCQDAIDMDAMHDEQTWYQEVK